MFAHDAISRSAYLFAFASVLFVALALIGSLLNNEQTPASVKIVVILGVLLLAFVFLLVIPALLTMMVRASL